MPLSIAHQYGDEPVVPANVILQGHAVGTTILVRRVEIWRGVRDDIDWNNIRPVSAVPGIGPPRSH